MVESKESAESYIVGTRLPFCAGAVIEKYLLEGWSAQETHHRWTDGSPARLELQLSEKPSKDLLLRIECHAFVPPKQTFQSVEVRVNYRRVATWRVHAHAWYEAIIPISVVKDGKLVVTLTFPQLTSPFDHKLSDDKRKLGLYVTSVEVNESLSTPSVQWIGSGDDPIGDVLEKDGNYFRAIKKGASQLVAQLRSNGIYDELALRKLIPKQSFSEVHHSKYAALAMTEGATWNIYAANYVFLTLQDAARVWLDINELLLAKSDSKKYGLVDGHYGNFALFGNSRPLWVDAGSIVELTDLPAMGLDGWFALDQFVRCFVYPLQMYTLQPRETSSIRGLMHMYPQGIPHTVAADMIGAENVLNVLDKRSMDLTRAVALSRLRALVERQEFKPTETTWSGYRNFTALEWAISGKYLADEQDARFRTIVELAKASDTRTFLDVGANDGLWSIMCAVDGKKGIATDTDDVSLNRLYEFLGSHPELSISVSRVPFTHIDHVADLVLALALTHHLVLSQNLSFTEIAQRLAGMCKKVLITEFMPDGLGGTQNFPDPSPNPLPAGYSLAKYCEALATHFRLVRVVTYERKNAFSRRDLIYCER